MHNLMFNNLLEVEWGVFLIVGVILLLSAEFGYRVGLRNSPEKRKVNHAPSGALQAALLGLLGLLLGFTFAMAVGRFDARRQLVLDESNAIGTAWLRAGFLSDFGKQTERITLMDYIDARLLAANLAPDSEEFKKQLTRSEADQAAMWRTAVAEMKAVNAPSTSLFTTSLNDLIDLDSKRQMASRNHVPSSVWLLLMLVSCTVCWATGYTTGLGESGRFALAMFILPILITIVITIISDLDNPRHGLIQVSQRSMLDVQQTLQKYQ